MWPGVQSALRPNENWRFDDENRVFRDENGP